MAERFSSSSSSSSSLSSLSLPAKMFLLTYDARRDRFTARAELGYLLRAAALADLVLRGHLADESGKAWPVKPFTGADPVLSELWGRITGAPPRSWRRRLGPGRRQAIRSVRDQLAEAGLIGLEPRRALGLIPYSKVTVRDQASVRSLGERVGRAIRGGEPAVRVAPDCAVLAALAASAGLRVVLKLGERRRYRQRLAELGRPVEPICTALR
ncbi:GPP34 family phosphoprotein, partial [Amycolatopsis rhizosphaerae]